MWPVLFLLGLVGWKERQKGEKLLWPVGEGRYFCKRDQDSACAHVTVAAISFVTGSGFTRQFFSEYIYGDIAASVEGKAETYPSAVQPYKWCMSTRESSVGTHRVDYSSRPRPHSEIAALQHLFGISGGLDVNGWIRSIYARLSEHGDLYTGDKKHVITQFRVFLFNSAHSPCGPQTEVGTTHRGMRGRMCCDTFLTQVAGGVSELLDFTIVVINKDHEVKMYGRRMGTFNWRDFASNSHALMVSSGNRRRGNGYRDHLEEELIRALCKLLIDLLLLDL